MPLATAAGHLPVSARLLMSISCVRLVRPLARVSSPNNVSADILLITLVYALITMALTYTDDSSAGHSRGQYRRRHLDSLLESLVGEEGTERRTRDSAVESAPE